MPYTTQSNEVGIHARKYPARSVWSFANRFAKMRELEGKRVATYNLFECQECNRRNDSQLVPECSLGWRGIPGTVTFVAERPSTMGEYIHKVRTEHGERTELGCSLELIPEAVTNLDTRASPESQRKRQGQLKALPDPILGDV